MSKKRILQRMLATILTILPVGTVVAMDEIQFDNIAELKTKEATIEQQLAIYKQLKETGSTDVIESDKASSISFKEAITQNPRIIENLEMLNRYDGYKLFLDKVYKMYAPDLFHSSLSDIEKMSEKQKRANYSEADSEKAEALFKETYLALKAGEEAKGDGKFPVTVSKWGNYITAAKDRIILEELLQNPATYTNVVTLLQHAYLLDTSVPLKIDLPLNPNKKTTYGFIDGKTDEVTKQNPNFVAHILADAVTPGGGMLKGTNAQEESTLRQKRELQLALYTLASAGYYPLGQLQALTIGNHVFSAMLNNDPTSSGYDSPELAMDYVRTMSLKVDSLMLAAAVQSQNLANDSLKTLVLGAAGCGAFKNNPKLVAEMFEDKLQKIHGYYDQVLVVILGAETRYNIDKDPSSGKFFQPFMDTVERLKAKFPESNGEIAYK